MYIKLPSEEIYGKST